MAQIQLSKNIIKMFDSVQINGIDYKTEETAVSPSAQQILDENRESAQTVLQSSIEQEIGQEVKAVELNETLHNVKDELARNNILKEVSTRTREITRVEGLIESEASIRASTDAKLQKDINTEVSTRAREITRVEGLIESEVSTRASTDATLNNNINTINSKIPSQASKTNQLADKDFVNSSIATNTANFIGTFTDIEELKRQPATNNDYAFWLTTDSAGNILFKRYKYIASTNSWVFEYDLNNSSFTSEQWLAIQSGITAVLVAKLKGIEEGAQVNTITGVKGGNESSYRTGNVNITKDNVGLGNVVNTGDSATPKSGGTTKFTTGGAYTELAKKNDKITITDDSSTALTDADTFSTTGNTGTNPTNLTKRPLSLLWTYIKGKADSVYAKLSHTHTKSQITDFPTSLKNPNALTVNGKTYDGSSAVYAGVQTVANGGTGQTTENAAANAFINSLSIGSAVPEDNDYYISQYANGGTTFTTYYRRSVSKLWEYIKGKADSVYAKLSHTHTKSQITDFPTSLPANGGTANTAKSALSVADYGNTSHSIKIGYSGPSATTDNLSYIAGYLSGGNQIKNVSKDTLKSWLDLGSAPYIDTLDIAISSKVSVTMNTFTSSAINAPVATDGLVITHHLSSTKATQLALCGAQLFTRTYSNSTWSAWTAMWNTEES